jgi:glutamate 5-kinase
MITLREQFLAKSERVVIKVGSRLLVDLERMDLNRRFMNQLVNSIHKVQGMGKEVVLVSSGAVGAGMVSIGMKERPTDIGMIQACASIGQIKLSHVYESLFARKGLHTGQVLVSADDFRIRERYKNIRNTVEALLAQGCIPIINENDTVAVDEIKVGDNDKLSADVTQFFNADVLMVFTDENGLYDANPKEDPDAKLIPVVSKINKSILKLAGSKGSGISTGGMKTKLQAIRQAVEAGCAALMANGFEVKPHEIFEGAQDGTFFLPSSDQQTSRKRWLGLVSHTHGQIVLDHGAVKAIEAGRSSLLSVGVVETKGEFNTGDIVELVSQRGRVIGRGLAKYRHDEINQISGFDQVKVKKWYKSQFPESKRPKHPEIVVHRNDLFLAR